MRKINVFICCFLCFFKLLYPQKDFQGQIDKQEKKYLELYFSAEKHKVLEEYQQALILYEKCISVNPEESSAYNELAKIYFNSKEWDNAEYYIKEAISLDPENKWYYYLLLDLCAIQNKLYEQLEVYSNLIKLEEENYLYYMQKVQVLKELKLYKKAIKFIQKTEKKFGESNDLLIELKSIYLAQNNFNKSEELVLRLIRQAPNETRYYHDLAAVYMHFSDYDSAISTYIKILEDEPNDPKSLIALYKIYSNKQDLNNQEKYLSKIANNPIINIESKKEIFYKLLRNNNFEAFDSFKKIVQEAIQFAPDEPLFNLILADLYAKDKNYKPAITHYKKSLNSTFVKDEYVYIKLVEIYFYQDNFDLVIHTIEEAIEKYPLSSQLYYYQGLAFVNKKQYNEALNSLLKGEKFVVENNSLKSEFYSLIGDSYHNLQSHKLSDQSYDKALFYNPNNVFVLNNYSYYLALREEQLILAKEMSVKCNELTKDAPVASFLDTYAWVLYKLAEYNLAKKEIEKAIELDPNNSTLLDHFGDILDKLSFKKEALVQWRKALLLDPQNTILKTKIKTHE